MNVLRERTSTTVFRIEFPDQFSKLNSQMACDARVGQTRFRQTFSNILIKESYGSGYSKKVPKQRDVKVTKRVGVMGREGNAQPYLRKSLFINRLRGDFTMTVPRTIPRETAKVPVQENSRNKSAQKVRRDGTQRDVPEKIIEGDKK